MATYTVALFARISERQAEIVRQLQQLYGIGQAELIRRLIDDRARHALGRGAGGRQRDAD